MDYQAKSWDRPEKLYAKVESTGKGMNIRYFASNFENMTARQIYFGFYVKRGDASENRIKELKNMTYADRLSCPSFWANFLRLMTSTLCLRNVSPDQIDDCQNKTLLCQMLAGG